MRRLFVLFLFIFNVLTVHLHLPTARNTDSPQDLFSQWMERNRRVYYLNYFIFIFYYLLSFFFFFFFRMGGGVGFLGSFVGMRRKDR